MRTPLTALGILCLSVVGVQGIMAQETIETSVGVDVMSRYIWRGINVGDAPSLQPTLAFSYKGFELGAWGAYSLSNQITDGDEIDFWVGYNVELEDGGAIGFLITDYYFPNSGVKFSNFSDWDGEDGPGAHTLEVGGSFTLPGSFPLTVAAYMNFHNDEGQNTYFQADYPLTLGDTDLNLFAGATGGSEENPALYGAESFEFINLGMTAGKEIPLSSSFSLPVSASWILNPNQDISYLVVGFSF